MFGSVGSRYVERRKHDGVSVHDTYRPTRGWGGVLYQKCPGAAPVMVMGSAQGVSQQILEKFTLLFHMSIGTTYSIFNPTVKELGLTWRSFCRGPVTPSTRVVRQFPLSVIAANGHNEI